MRGMFYSIVALAVLSCARSVPLAPLVTELDTRFTLRTGQTAVIEDSPLRLRFVSVVEDSRCPVDVDCVWAGDAQVHLVITHDELDETLLDLHTEVEPSSALVHGYRVQLERLDPLPRSDRRIPSDEYAAEFRVHPPQ